MPQVFYTCSSLRTLALSSCAFDRGVVISWKSLKTVKFSTVVLKHEEIGKLLSDCPTLETLELSCFYAFRHLEINNSNLKRLKLKDSWPAYEEGDHTLEIAAPYLQHLEISGDIDDVKSRLVNVSSLVSVELIFEITCVSNLQDHFVYVIET